MNGRSAPRLRSAYFIFHKHICLQLKSIFFFFLVAAKQANGQQRGNSARGRGGRGGRGRGRSAGQKRQPKEQITAEELDSQLESYISNKMDVE